jgi:hypothetical protein
MGYMRNTSAMNLFVVAPLALIQYHISPMLTPYLVVDDELHEEMNNHRNLSYEDFRDIICYHIAGFYPAHCDEMVTHIQ